MKPESIFDRARELAAQADEGARTLRLTEFEENGKLARYLLRGRWWSWVEVVVLRNGHLLVHGDIDAVIFGIYRGYERARSVLYWMANAGADYAEQKASIGSSGKIATEWSAEVALWYVKDWLREDVIKGPEAAELEAVLLRGGSQQDFVEAIVEAFDGDYIDYVNAGEVTATSVFNAQGALRQLCRELESRDFRAASRAWFRRVA